MTTHAGDLRTRGEADALAAALEGCTGRQDTAHIDGFARARRRFAGRPTGWRAEHQQQHAGNGALRVTHPVAAGFPNTASSNFWFSVTFSMSILCVSWYPSTAVSTTKGIITPFTSLMSRWEIHTLCNLPSRRRGIPSIFPSGQIKQKIPTCV